MKSLFAVLFVLGLVVPALADQAAEDAAENAADLQFVSEVFTGMTSGGEQNLWRDRFLCAKAKTARLACIGVATTTTAKANCNLTWCETIRTECGSVPSACLQ